jgi:hypothetical protein
MGETSPLDDRGRFTVDPKFRKFLGPRVIQILTPDGLLLVPAKRKLDGNALPPSLSVDGDALYEEDEAQARTERR